MVLKDWKKVNGHGISNWENSKKKLLLAYGEDENNKFEVVLWSDNTNFDGKTLKKKLTKSQALKFARSYMRTH